VGDPLPQFATGVTWRAHELLAAASASGDPDLPADPGRPHDARNAPGVTGIEAGLMSTPPGLVEHHHDGESHLAADAFRDHPLVALGPPSRSSRAPAESTVSLALNDRGPKNLPHLVPERIGLIP